MKWRLQLRRMCGEGWVEEWKEEGTLDMTGQLIRKRSERNMQLAAVGDAPIVLCETYLFVNKTMLIILLV